MKKALLIMMLICPFILGQDLAKNDNKKAEDKKPVAPAAKTIDDTDDVKAWQAVQQPLLDNQTALNKLVETAQLAAPKDAATKAQLWSDLETAFLRNQRDGAAYEAFLAKMQSKYACSGCQITVAPDGKTLVIKPKSAQ